MLSQWCHLENSISCSLNSNRCFSFNTTFLFNNQYNNKIQESLWIAYTDPYLGMTLGYRQFLPVADFYLPTLSFKASLYSLGINRSSCFEDIIVFSFPLYCGLSIGFLPKQAQCDTIKKQGKPLRRKQLVKVSLDGWYGDSRKSVCPFCFLT